MIVNPIIILPCGLMRDNFNGLFLIAKILIFRILFLFDGNTYVLELGDSL